jgi:hypothetical protein
MVSLYKYSYSGYTKRWKRIIPVGAMKGYGRNTGISQFILILGSRRLWVVNVTSQPGRFNPREEPRHRFNRRLGGFQSRFLVQTILHNAAICLPFNLHWRQYFRSSGFHKLSNYGHFLTPVWKVIIYWAWNSLMCDKRLMSLQRGSTEGWRRHE